MARAMDSTATYARLGTAGAVTTLRVGDRFWEDLAAGRLGSFQDGFLLSTHDFESDWSQWEMHPRGEEVVCLLSGEITMILESDGEQEAVHLRQAGDFMVVPRGTWHSARCDRPSRVLFITAGEGTQHRGV